MVSNIHQALVIQRILSPHILSQMATYNLASTIHQSLALGELLGSACPLKCLDLTGVTGPGLAGFGAGADTRPLVGSTSAVYVTGTTPLSPQKGVRRDD